MAESPLKLTSRPTVASALAAIGALAIAILLLHPESGVSPAVATAVALCAVGSLLGPGPLRISLGLSGMIIPLGVLVSSFGKDGAAMQGEQLALACTGLGLAASGLAKGRLSLLRHAVFPGMALAATELFSMVFGTVADSRARGGSPALAFSIVVLGIATISLQRGQRPWRVLIQPGRVSRAARRTFLSVFLALLFASGVRLLAGRLGYDPTPHLLAFMTVACLTLIAVLILRDTARELRSRRELEFRSRLLDQVGEAVIATDRQGRVTFWNRAAEATYGWTAAEAIGRDILELTPSPDAVEPAAAVMEMLRGGSRWSGRMQLQRRDRSSFWAAVTDSVLRDDDGEIESVVGVSRDITHEVKQEQELLLRDQRMRTVGRATLDVAWDYDVVTGQMWWGDEIARLVGDETPGDLDWWASRTHPDDSRRVLDSIHRSLEGHAERWAEEYRFRKADEGWVWILDRGFIVRDESGRAVRMTGTMMDISERKLQEAEIRRSERLTSLGRLAATVAHEFNNVLMGIQPFADILSRTAADETHRRVARQITSAVSRGRRITHDVLKFTRPSEPDRHPLPLAEWIESTRPEWGAVLGERVSIALEAREPELRVSADRNQLHQLMMNLLLNAGEAMEGAGTITIRVSSPAPGQAFDFGVVPSPERFAHIEVSDTGRGIPEEILPHIFEPLFTTKHSGTGLGLPVCHQIVRQHEGQIFAESRSGEGATIHVFLPLAAAAAPRLEPHDSGPTARRGRKVDVLLIEDDVQVADGLAMLLDFEGYSARIAGTGAAGLAEIAARTPDVVILDVGLPDVSGVELFHILERRYPGLRIIFSSGHQDVEALERFLRSGVEFLRKPYEMETLVAALDRVLEREAVTRS